jgi:DNA-binding NarL/FixJ family response regulator
MTAAITPRLPLTPLITQDELSALIASSPAAPMKAPIEIMFADPHPVVIDGLTQTFQYHPDFRVKTCAHDGASAWRDILRLEPDILVMELTLDGKDSLSLIRDLRREGVKTLPVIFTHTGMLGALEAVAAGVRGLVFKTQPKEVLMECVREVHQGRKWLDDAFSTPTLAADAPPLTRSVFMQLLTLRELSVVQLLIRGRSNRDIATTFSISEGTVKVHLKHIYQKLQCESRVDLLSRIRRDIC